MSRLVAACCAVVFLVVGWASLAHAGAHAACAGCGHAEADDPAHEALLAHAHEGHLPHAHGVVEPGEGPDHGAPAPCDPTPPSRDDCSLCRVLAAPGAPVSLPAPLPRPDAVLVPRAPAPAAISPAAVSLLGLARGPPDASRR